MNRRRLIQLSLLSALAPAQQLHAQKRISKNTGSPKKGLGQGMAAEDWLQRLEALRCKWFYSWTSRIPDDLPREITYVPMIFKFKGNRDEVLNAVDAAKKARKKELLSFNEPDHKNQAGMTVEEAIEAWPMLEESGLLLGSPATVHADNEWMQSFMEEAKKRKYRVDFVCVHSYGPPDPENLYTRLEKIRKLYRKPIWITEFAAGDWQAQNVAANQHSEEAVLRFMEKILPKLERMDFVERYAWFPAKPDHKALGTSALFDAEGKLTRLGECYRDA